MFASTNKVTLNCKLIMMRTFTAYYCTLATPSNQFSDWVIPYKKIALMIFGQIRFTKRKNGTGFCKILPKNANGISIIIWVLVFSRKNIYSDWMYETDLYWTTWNIHFKLIHNPYSKAAHNNIFQNCLEMVTALCTYMYVYLNLWNPPSEWTRYALKTHNKWLNRTTL